MLGRSFHRNATWLLCCGTVALAACGSGTNRDAVAILGGAGSTPTGVASTSTTAGTASAAAAGSGTAASAAGTSAIGGMAVGGDAQGTSGSSATAGVGGGAARIPAGAAGSGGSAGATAEAGSSGASAGGGGGGAEATPPVPFEGEGMPWTAAAPRATCAENDQKDGSLSGLSEDLRCNLEVVGQVEAPHFLSLAWHKECAYVNGPDGTTVIQVAADGKPTVTTTLTEVRFRSNWESMKANATSGLMSGYEANGSLLTTYDLNHDCAKPELASSLRLDGALSTSIGHAGSFSPDGTIYYASSMYTGEVFAVDLANPKAPKLITTAFEAGAHDLYIGKNGTRGYFAVPDVVTQALGVGSFAVMDLTQVQARAAAAKGTKISELTWEDGSTSQYPILLSYRGKDYLMINDELGSGVCTDPAKPQWGYARIFDMSDEKKPKLVSLIKTEAHEPKNCEAAGMAEGGTGGFGVGTHYCNVDRLEDPRLLSCGIQAGGVRIYDIRNPWRPKELAYFSKVNEAVPGLQRIYIEKRELWLATQPGTFYVLKFPPGSPIDQILSE